MIITKEWLNSSKTPAGGYRKKQVLALGVGTSKGWRSRAIGKDLSPDKVKLFESFSKKKPTPKVKRDVSFRSLIALVKDLTRDQHIELLIELANYRERVNGLTSKQAKQNELEKLRSEIGGLRFELQKMNDEAESYLDELQLR